MDQDDDFQAVNVARLERRQRAQKQLKRASGSFSGAFSDVKRPKTPAARRRTSQPVQGASPPHGSGSPLNLVEDSPPQTCRVAEELVLSQPAACPVCACRLADVSDTHTGRAAHVNACLDAAAAAAVSAGPPTWPAAVHAAEPGREQELPQEASTEAARLPVDGSADGLLAELGTLPDVTLQVLSISQVFEDTPPAEVTAAAAASGHGAADYSCREQADHHHHHQQQQQQQQQPDYCPYEDVLAEVEPLWQPCQDQLDDDDDDGAASDHGQQLLQQRPDQQQQQAEQCQYMHAQDWQPGQQDCMQQEWQQPEWQDHWFAAREQQDEQQQPEQWHMPPAPQQHQEQQPRWPAGAPLQLSSAANQAARPSRSSSWQQGGEGGIQGGITGCFTQQPPPQQQQQVIMPAPARNGGENLQHRNKAAQAKQQWQVLFNRPTPVGGAAAPAGSRVQRQRTLAAAQQQQQQQLDATAALARLPARSASLPNWWPAWRRLPGTNIVVDAFGDSSKALGANRSWILTHFHADHYMGLGRSFKQGVIICTPITAALVRLKLKVAPEQLLPLPLGQQLEVEGIRIELLDANHCPGAAMVVAHPPGGAAPVLHTGDARLTAAATQGQPALQALRGRAVLVLDTTYADPAYCFPPQQEVLNWCLRAVRAESFNPRCLFLFGSYTIGKERLFMHVAATLKRKVYVCAAKRSVMACLDLPPEQAQLLTTNHLEANIHVVQMRQVTLEAMETLLQRYKGRYTAVVGFQPTGWTHGGGGRGGSAAHQPSRSSSTARPSKRLQRGTVVLYQLPYSEHSSCAELREFVAWFRPLRIIPSVNNDKGRKLQAMLEAITAPAKATTGPMDAFARRNTPAAAAGAVS